MEREISVAVEIGVTLIALSVVISIIWFTVYLGNTMANDVTIEASDIVASNEVGSLEELCDTNTVMPTSAVYSLLRTYSSNIPEYRCNFHSTPTELDLTETQVACILQHMTGKVSLEVQRTDGGWYRVIIHHMNCDWYTNNYDNSPGAPRCPGCIAAEEALNR